jgi:hypothetical protein
MRNFYKAIISMFLVATIALTSFTSPAYAFSEEAFDEGLSRGIGNGIATLIVGAGACLITGAFFPAIAPATCIATVETVFGLKGALGK